MLFRVLLKHILLVGDFKSKQIHCVCYENDSINTNGERLKEFPDDFNLTQLCFFPMYCNTSDCSLRLCWKFVLPISGISHTTVDTSWNRGSPSNALADKIGNAFAQTTAADPSSVEPSQGGPSSTKCVTAKCRLISTTCGVNGNPRFSCAFLGTYQRNYQQEIFSFATLANGRSMSKDTLEKTTL